MPFGVTLFIDNESEAFIKNLWQQIRDSGISSFMIDRGVRPHITLAVYDDLDVDSFLSRLSSLIKDISVISFLLSSIGVFLNQKGTVFVAPTVTHRLMNMHSYFHEYFQSLEHSLSEYSLPGNWFPHFTLAAGLSEKEITKVITIGLNAAVPEQSRIEEIGIGEFNYEEDSLLYRVTWVHNVMIK